MTGFLTLLIGAYLAVGFGLGGYFAFIDSDFQHLTLREELMVFLGTAFLWIPMYFAGILIQRRNS